MAWEKRETKSRPPRHFFISPKSESNGKLVSCEGNSGRRCAFFFPEIHFFSPHRSLRFLIQGEAFALNLSQEISDELRMRSPFPALLILLALSAPDLSADEKLPVVAPDHSVPVSGANAPIIPKNVAPHPRPVEPPPDPNKPSFLAFGLRKSEFGNVVKRVVKQVAACGYNARYVEIDDIDDLRSRLPKYSTYPNVQTMLWYGHGVEKGNQLLFRPSPQITNNIWRNLSFRSFERHSVARGCW